MLHNASNHAGLLSKLASGSNDLDTPNELLQQIVWDDELSPSLDSQYDLLQHLATGEERKVSTESALNDLLTPVNDQFSVLVTGVDSMHGVFVQFLHSVQAQFSLYDYRTVLTMLLECKQDGTIKEFAAQDVCKEMLWDEEQLHGLGLQAGLLQQGAAFIKYWAGEKRILVAKPTKDGMFLNHQHLQSLQLGRDALYEAFIEISFEEKVAAKAKQGDMPCENAVWEETSANLAVHEGLLQQLALGKEYMHVPLEVAIDSKDGLSGEMPSEIVWTEHILYDLETYVSLLQRQVIGVADMENEKKTLMVNLIEDQMLPVIDIFQLLQEHGIEVADQMLEHMQPQLVTFKAQVLSECDAHKHVTQFGESLVDGDIKPTAVMEHLYHICFGACSRHELKCDCNHLVISDAVCKSQLFVDAYLMEVKHKEVIISRSQWDPGIWSYLVMGLTLRLGEIPVLTMFILKFSEVFSLPILCIIILTRHLAHLLLTECMDFSDISNSANQVMVQATINPSLSEKRLVMHSNLLEKSVWDYNTEIAWSRFSPRSRHTTAHKQQQLEIYWLLERQWDPGIHRPVLIHTESVLIIGSFWRYASQLMVKAIRTSSYHNSVRAVAYLCDTDNMGKMEFSFLLDSHLINLKHKKTHVSFRQWDPGIMQWTVYEYNCCNGSFSWIENFNVLYKQFLNTTAWGQAVLCSGGMRPRSTTTRHATPSSTETVLAPPRCAAASPLRPHPQPLLL